MDENKVKTLGAYIRSAKFKKDPSILIGKEFSDYTSKVAEKKYFESWDQTTYKILKVWKDNASGDFMVETSTCDFGQMGLAGKLTLNLSKPFLVRQNNFPELIEGVNAEMSCPLVMGPSI